MGVPPRRAGARPRGPSLADAPAGVAASAQKRGLLHEELDTHHKRLRTHKQSTPRAGEGLPAGSARLGRAALQWLRSTCCAWSEGSWYVWMCLFARVAFGGAVQGLPWWHGFCSSMHFFACMPYFTTPDGVVVCVASPRGAAHEVVRRPNLWRLRGAPPATVRGGDTNPGRETSG